MTLNPKRIGLYSVIGVLAAVVIIAGVFATGVQLPSSNPPAGNNQQGNNNPSGNNPFNPALSGMGTLIVSIKDKPADLERLDITISGIYAQRSVSPTPSPSVSPTPSASVTPDGESPNDDSPSSNSWIELTLSEDGSKPFDLLALTDTSIMLSEQGIPVGSYTKLRLEVTSAIATYADSTTEKPHIQELKVPPGHIDIQIKFEIKEGRSTQVLIDMQPDTVAISQSGNLKPVIKATVTEQPTTSPTPNSAIQSGTSPTEAPTETPTTSPTPDNTSSPSTSPTPGGSEPTPTPSDATPTPTTQPTSTAGPTGSSVT